MRKEVRCLQPCWLEVPEVAVQQPLLLGACAGIEREQVTVCRSTRSGQDSKTLLKRVLL